MADEKKPDPPAIKAYDRHGEKITITKDEIGKLYALGGRVATKAEQTEAQLQADYENQSLGQKALGLAKYAGPAGSIANIVGEAVTGKAGVAAPQMEAYREGTGSGATAGINQSTERIIRDTVAGKASGEAYAKRLDDLKEAHPATYTAGQVAGMVGGTLAGSEVAPAAAISKLGAAVESRVGGALAGLASKGAAGRAAVTAAELGARGATEAGAYAGLEHATDILTHDPDMAAQKLFSAEGLTSWGKAAGTAALYGGAGGALLGGAGSLAASGARETGSALARVMRRGGEAVADAGEGVAAKVGEAGESVAGKVGEAAEAVAAHPETTAARSVLRDLTTESGTKGLAYDRAWSSLGGGFGLQSTSFAKRATKYLQNGTRDVGEWLMRKGVMNPQAGIVDAARAGTPEAMIPKIQAEVEATGKRIGEITGTSGGTISAGDIFHVIDSVARGPESAGATWHVGQSVRELGARIMKSLSDQAPKGSIGEVLQGQRTFSVQDVLRERRALDDVLFDANTVNPKLAASLKEQLRGKLEGLVVDSLDQASGRLSGELATEYKALKKDYLAGMLALETAEDSAARAAKAGFFGLKDLVAGGGSIVKTAASKLVRVHGDAVAATQLYQAAERGTLNKWINRIDGQIDKASKGLLVPPAKGTPKAADRMPPTKALAKTALARVGEFQADPEGFVERTTRQYETVTSHSPEVAQALVAKSVSAMAFMASKVPVSPDPDPLDPHPAPKLTPGEQAELGRYWWYAEKPARFYAEVARGKLTWEGAEVARALTPGAFEQLQMKTADALATRLAKGERIPFRQRQTLGVLLDFAATPSQRPEHARFLQQNTQPIEEPPPPPAPRRSVASPNQQRSSYDRLEAEGPGGR
jgi:hypothetical protein